MSARVLSRFLITFSKNLYRGNNALTKKSFCSSSATKSLNFSQQVGKLDAKLFISFVCTPCGFKTNKLISKLAYQKGVVIIKCSSCKNNHLIADNLNWFQESGRNIEEILSKKGEAVRKQLNEGESLEVEIDQLK